MDSDQQFDPVTTNSGAEHDEAEDEHRAETESDSETDSEEEEIDYAERFSPSSSPEEIYELMESGKPYGSSMIADLADIPTRTAREYLDDLVDEGKALKKKPSQTNAIWVKINGGPILEQDEEKANRDYPSSPQGTFRAMVPGMPYGTAEIADRLDIPDRTAFHYLKELASEGKITQNDISARNAVWIRPEEENERTADSDADAEDSNSNADTESESESEAEATAND